MKRKYYIFILISFLFYYGCVIDHSKFLNKPKEEKVLIEFADLISAKKYFSNYYQDNILKIKFDEKSFLGVEKKIVKVDTKNYDEHLIVARDTNDDSIKDLYEIYFDKGKIPHIAFKYYKTNNSLVNLYLESSDYVQLGIGYFKQKNAPSSEKNFKKAIQIFENNSEANFYLGEVKLLLKKKYEAALNYYKKAFESDPTYKAAFERISQLNNIILLQARLSKDPENLRNRMSLALILVETSLLEEAAIEFQRLIRLQKDNYAALCYLGNIYAEKGLTEKAEYYYNISTKSIPDHPYAYKMLGELYQNKGIKGFGKKEFEKVKSLNEKNGVELTAPSETISDFLIDIGKIYLDKGMFEKALEKYEEAFNLNKDNCKTYYNLGLINVKLKKIQEAEKWYKMCIEINNGFEPALFSLGELYFFEKNYKEAFNTFNSAIKANPYNTESYIYLGLIYKELNMLSEAKLSFEKALQVNPFYKDADKIKNYIEDLKK